MQYSTKLKIIKLLFHFIPRCSLLYKYSIWYLRHYFGFNYGIGIELKFLNRKKLIFGEINYVANSFTNQKSTIFEYGAPNIFSKVFLKDIFTFFTNKDYKIFRIYPYWIKPIFNYSNDLENFIPVNYAAISSTEIGYMHNYIRNYPIDKL